ncbi:DUF2878 domain-containing protein [Idiomarina sp. X4]|uniref:DUF2878 domain-containing protein n=1 Tax=unclassified Idiomarina TaxID=2614829 RepID=UPI000C288E41|nr:MULTISPECIES: DUF2878 domain-containing protein [unclassified Idiomarina]ATZ74269.1 DUF2878 domain-containing protein [Idiomarina sp. X4]RXS44510.1 DUF2878 domain-containing protein [Idiomarina sp. 29L]
MHKIISFVLFNGIWFSAVVGRGDYLWLTVALVLIQVVYSLRIGNTHWTVMARLFAVGLLLEAISISLGVIDFEGGYFPLWLALLWLGFAAMAPVALDWLAKKTWLALIAGAVSGPVTYMTGVQFGAAAIESTLVTVVTYAAVWSLMMGYFVYLMTSKPNERKEILP